MTKHSEYVMIQDEWYPVDTDEELQVAMAALQESCQAYVYIHTSRPPDDPSRWDHMACWLHVTPYDDELPPPDGTGDYVRVCGKVYDVNTIREVESVRRVMWEAGIACTSVYSRSRSSVVRHRYRDLWATGMGGES